MYETYLELESPLVPELGENVACSSVVVWPEADPVWTGLAFEAEAEVVALEAASTVGGSNLSISALPNSQPAGKASSLHSAKRILLSQTSDVYSLERPRRTLRPSSEPQLPTYENRDNKNHGRLDFEKTINAFKSTKNSKILVMISALGSKRGQTKKIKALCSTHFGWMI